MSSRDSLVFTILVLSYMGSHHCVRLFTWVLGILTVISVPPNYHFTAQHWLYCVCCILPKAREHHAVSTGSADFPVKEENALRRVVEVIWAVCLLEAFIYGNDLATALVLKPYILGMVAESVLQTIFAFAYEKRELFHFI